MSTFKLSGPSTKPLSEEKKRALVRKFKTAERNWEFNGLLLALFPTSQDESVALLRHDINEAMRKELRRQIRILETLIQHDVRFLTERLRYCRNPADKADCFHDIVVGYITAIKEFDLSQDTALLTFAGYKIMASIQKGEKGRSNPRVEIPDSRRKGKEKKYAPQIRTVDLEEELHPGSSGIGDYSGDDISQTFMDVVHIKLPRPDEDLEGKERFRVLKRAISLLDPDEREVIESLFLSDPGITGAELAEKKGCARSWINVLKHRALRKLRKSIKVKHFRHI